MHGRTSAVARAAAHAEQPLCWLPHCGLTALPRVRGLLSFAHVPATRGPAPMTTIMVIVSYWLDFIFFHRYVVAPA